MSNHDRGGHLLRLCEHKELPCKRACGIAVEVDKLRYKETVEDGVQKERVLDVLPQSFRLLDHDAGLVKRRSCLGGGETLRMIQSVRKPNLKLDLFAAQRGRCRQRRNLVKGACELCDRFDQREALQ